jgi:hypothetical protein
MTRHARVARFTSHALAVGLGAAACLALGLGRAPAVQPENLNNPEAMKAAMKAWMDSMKPGQQHAFLQQFIGEWTTTTRIRMAPGAQPIETKGTAKIVPAHGGRFIQQTNAGQFLMPTPDGKMNPVELTGIGFTGFDNNRKQFVMCWTDNYNTGILSAAGSISQDQTTITMFGTMDEPMTGEMGKTVRYVTKLEGKDKFTFRIDEVQYGEPFNVVEVEYNRVKPDMNK